jgi:hypothetical protein
MKTKISKLFCAIVLSLSVIAGAVLGPVQIAAAGGTGGAGGAGGGVLSAPTILK